MTQILDQLSQSLITEAICHAARMAQDDIRNAAASYERPSVLFRPSVTIDGNQWCALYGDNLQDGVAGFGDSPADAMHDFDRNWWAKLPAKKAEPDTRASDVLRAHGFRNCGPLAHDRPRPRHPGPEGMTMACPKCGCKTGVPV